MKEPDRRPLDPSTPRIKDVEKKPLPSLDQESSRKYPEPMTDDVVSGGAEQAFSNFIQKAKESKRKYEERLEKLNQENKDKDGFYQ